VELCDSPVAAAAFVRSKAGWRAEDHALNPAGDEFIANREIVNAEIPITNLRWTLPTSNFNMDLANG
jgi:hypothetical protein